MKYPIIQSDGIPLVLKANGDTGVWYGLGLEQLLDGLTISGATWTVPVGLTKAAEAVPAVAETHEGIVYAANTLAKVSLSGGTAGTKYRCSVAATASDGQVFERALDVLVRESL